MERYIRISTVSGIEETIDSVQYEDWMNEENLPWYFYRINTTKNIIYAKISALTYHILNTEYGISSSKD